MDEICEKFIFSFERKIFEAKSDLKNLKEIHTMEIYVYCQDDYLSFLITDGIISWSDKKIRTTDKTEWVSQNFIIEDYV